MTNRNAGSDDDRPSERSFGLVFAVFFAAIDSDHARLPLASRDDPRPHLGKTRRHLRHHGKLKVFLALPVRAELTGSLRQQTAAEPDFGVDAGLHQLLEESVVFGIRRR